MTLADFDYITNPTSQDSFQLIIDQDPPKIPFDLNDYLNFELNEDFISASAGFINDYPNKRNLEVSSAGIKLMGKITLSSNSSEYRHFEKISQISKSTNLYQSTDTIEIEFQDKQLQKIDNEVPLLEDGDDLFPSAQANNHSASNNSFFDSSFTPSLGIPIDSSPTYEVFTKNSYLQNYQYNSKTQNEGKFTDDSIFDSSNLASSCKAHMGSSSDSDDTNREVRYLRELNDNMLQHLESEPMMDKILNKAITSSLVVAPVVNKRMKRHASYSDELSISQQIEQNDRSFLHAQDYASLGDNDRFYQCLLEKLAKVKEDPEQRLVELQQKIDMRNMVMTIAYH